MKKTSPKNAGRIVSAGVAAALGLSLCATRPAEAQHPTWINSAVIYDVQPEIFSPSGNFAGVTAQITRLHNMGVNVLWIEPFTQRGQPVTVAGVAHPAFNSMYCVHDYYSINPNYGTATDLTNLITAAHNAGMKVIFDEVINHTSWDNALITAHPEYYLHSDGNSTNVASIEVVNQGTSQPLNDIAQLNYANTATQTYITTMLKSMITTYNIDGFRFDMADNPTGPTRLIPKSYWQTLRTSLEATKNDILMLGEEEAVDIATQPFELDYGWNMLFYGTRAAFTQTNNASTLQYQWTNPYTINNTSPAGMLHMNIGDDWDTDRDVITYGGYPQAMAAATFNFTIDGVPLMYNGMEVANNNGGINSHTQINWGGANSTQFTNFYNQLLALRNGSGGALQQGTLTWVTNSSAAVTSYDRTGGGNEYLVEINTNGGAVSGTISPPAGGAWVDVTPVGSPGGQAHTLPPNMNLTGYDFAVFKRSSGPPPTATPTFSLASGTYIGNQTLTMSDATSGATIYYTTNGSTPTTASTVYTGPITISTSETVQAIALAASHSNSGVFSATYSVFPGTGGSISSTVAATTTATTYNLTTLGTADWAAYGLASSGSFDHKSTGGGQISNAATVGNSGAGQFADSIVGLTWTDGTPDTSATNTHTGLYVNATTIGNGLSFTLPADTTTRTATVYLGGWTSGGKLVAHLSDFSAGDYTNTSLSSTTGSYFGVYNITYHAGQAGQTLTVSWTAASGTGNVTLQGVALVAGAGTPTAATPTFSPAPGSYNNSTNVTLSDTTPGAAIHYTTDGSTPTAASPTYSAAIAVTSTKTIQAIATATGYTNSNVATGVYTIVTPPATPSGLAATAGNAQVSLSWAASSGATSYNIYRSTTAGGEGTTAIATSSTTSYTNTGLTNGTIYYYKVAAVNTAGTSGQSAEVNATPNVQIPAVPANLAAAAGNAQVALTWTASSGATSYNIYRSTTAGGEGTTAIATSTTASYTNTGLTNGTKYYYKVAAVNTAGTSAQSSEVNATPATSSPYGGTAAAIPGTVQVENFDLGGEGVGYHDADTANQGGQYRTTEGVDIETCTDTGGGFNVGFTQPGEWMHYTVNVATAGTYTVGFRVASGSTGGTLHLANSGGTNLSGTVTVPGTGGWQTWTTVNATVTLPAGQQVLTVMIDSGAGAMNINYLTFTSNTYTGTPFAGVISLPGTIQIENFDNGGEGVAYHDSETANQGGQYRTTLGVDIEACSDTGGGYDVGWTQGGEWEKFTVNATTAKTYTVNFRIASGFASGTQVAQIHLEDKNGVNLTGVKNVIATGGWQTWTNLSATATLPAGSNVIKLVIDGSNNGFNINYVSLN